MQNEQKALVQWKAINGRVQRKETEGYNDKPFTVCQHIEKSSIVRLKMLKSNFTEASLEVNNHFTLYIPQVI